MSKRAANEDPVTLPNPVSLTPEDIRQVAAGTAALLPAAINGPILYGGFPVGPIWEGTSEQV